MTALVYRWPGPVARAFGMARGPVDGIMGPYGSGKTTAAFIKHWLIAGEQIPHPQDNARRFRGVVLRDTYRNIWQSTIPSWYDYFPKAQGEWNGGKGEPAEHRLERKLPDGTWVLFEMLFRALGENNIVDVMRGFQFTRAILEEGDLLPPDAIKEVFGRAGRYPRREPAIGFDGAVHKGVDITFNATDTEHHFHTYFVDERLPSVGYFRQPGGLTPGAENKHNLVPNYYEDMIATQGPRWAKRYVHNRWGAPADGEPVYEEFDEDIHVAHDPLRAIPQLPLMLGFDAGGTPAVSFRQYLPNGQWRGYGSLYVGKVGPSDFGAAVNQHLHQRFPDCEDLLAACDPSAVFPGSRDEDWAATVGRVMKLRIKPAPTNNLTPRLDAVRLPMKRLIDGHQPGYLLCPTARPIIAAYNGRYRYQRVRRGDGGWRVLDEPEKSHPVSDIADADQYIPLTFGEKHAVQGREQKRRKPWEAQGGGYKVNESDAETASGGWA